MAATFQYSSNNLTDVQLPALNYATRAQIKCNTFPAVLLCTYSVFDKFEITGLI